jgi:hypothetical protein
MAIILDTTALDTEYTADEIDMVLAMVWISVLQRPKCYRPGH